VSLGGGTCSNKETPPETKERKKEAPKGPASPKRITTKSKNKKRKGEREDRGLPVQKEGVETHGAWRKKEEKVKKGGTGKVNEKIEKKKNLEKGRSNSKAMSGGLKPDWCGK